MAPYSSIHRAGLVGITLVMACAPGFKISRFTTSESLFNAGVREFRARRWDNAVQVFERLTVDLPVRDTLLPHAHFYLGQAHAAKGEHLLAAQEFSRLAESFATDSLADDAQYAAAREYQKMWRKPDLDPTYGGEAVAAYQVLIALYPDSELRDSATKQLEVLDQMYAQKDSNTGELYFRRKAYDSAIIYFKSVVDRYPRTPQVRVAYLRLAVIYERIRYKEDRTEVCATLRERYPRDSQVTQVCGAPPRVPAVKPDSR